MNVKKFEARSMKEALDMVKTQLGPDAVILSAKEVTKGFGLGGAKSIEITAAYSEQVLKKKEYVQSRMSESTKNNFDHISAKSQKEIMQKMIEQKLNQMQAQQRAQRIEDRAPKSQQNSLDRQPVSQTRSVSTPTRQKYIEIDGHDEAHSLPARQVTPILTQQAQTAWNNMEVQNLKGEIEQLKNLITQFKQIPQNFVQSHPGAELGINYNLSQFYTKLLGKGLLPEVAADILIQAQKQIDPQKMTDQNFVEAWVGRYILNSTAIVSGGFEQFHMFMGPSGSGKTTSMVKLASHLVLKHKKRVALISTDTIKVGADQQMKIFSEILNLPFISIRSTADWAKVIPYLDQVDHVLVDFASFSLKNNEEVKYLKSMCPPVFESVRTHLVLSAKSKDIDLLEWTKNYQMMNCDDLIITSLDEATQFGNIYNLIRKTSMPLYAFGIGPKVPDDLETATAERLLDLILQITKNMTQQERSL